MCSGQTSKASLSEGGCTLLLSIWPGKGRGSQQCWGCWRSWVPKIKSCYSCADAALEAHSPSNPAWLNTFTQLAAHLLPLSPKSMPKFYTLPNSPLEINLIFTLSTKIFKAKTHTHTHKHRVTHTYTNTFSCLTNIGYGAILKEEVSVLIKMDIYRNIYIHI